MSNAEIFGIFKKAAKLTKDPTNGCRVVSSKRHFALPPRYIGRLKKGAMEVLESEIGRYSECLHAVPLAFCDLKLLQQTGNILDDQPHIHFDVTFKAVVFQPAIGSVLKCVVNEFAGDHVSCLVHNWFNLSLPLPGPVAEQRLLQGSKVMVRVTRIRGKNGILAIQGKPVEERFADLQQPESNAELQPDLPGSTPSSSEKTPQKQKHDSGFFSNPDDSLGRPLELQSSEDDHQSKKKKKKKKKKKNEQSGDGLEPEESCGITSQTNPLESVHIGGHNDSEMNISQDLTLEEPLPKKKKKKKKVEGSSKDACDIVIKKERVDVEESFEDAESREEKPENESEHQKIIVIKQEAPDHDESQVLSESASKRRRKKKQGSNGNRHEENVAVKEEGAEDCDQSLLDGHDAKKKRKKTSKRGSTADSQLEDIKMEREFTEEGSQPLEDGNHFPKIFGVEEQVSCDLNQLDGQKKRKKKRKGDHLDATNVNSSEESFSRTTHRVSNVTAEDCTIPPPNKKKKHKKERKTM